MTDSSASMETGSIPGELSETDISFYKILLDNLYDGVYFVDLQRRISYWNRGAERLTGYSSQEAVGRSCFDNFLAHVDDKGCALCIRGCPLKSTMEDGKPREAEIYLRHRFGHRVPVSVRAAPIRNGTGTTIGAVEIFTDISDKKRAERRARGAGLLGRTHRSGKPAIHAAQGATGSRGGQTVRSRHGPADDRRGSLQAGQ